MWIVCLEIRLGISVFLSEKKKKKKKKKNNNKKERFTCHKYFQHLSPLHGGDLNGARMSVTENYIPKPFLISALLQMYQWR